MVRQAPKSIVVPLPCLTSSPFDPFLKRPVQIYFPLFKNKNRKQKTRKRRNTVTLQIEARVQLRAKTT